MKTDSDFVGVFSKELNCTWLSWKAVSDSEIVVCLPKTQSADMKGVIRTAELLMPGVKTVRTFSGDQPDMTYVRQNDGWLELFGRILVLGKQKD